MQVCARLRTTHTSECKFRYQHSVLLARDSQGCLWREGTQKGKKIRVKGEIKKGWATMNRLAMMNEEMIAKKQNDASDRLKTWSWYKGQHIYLMITRTLFKEVIRSESFWEEQSSFAERRKWWKEKKIIIIKHLEKKKNKMTAHKRAESLFLIIYKDKERN